MLTLPEPTLPATDDIPATDSPRTATRTVDGADVHAGDVVIFLGQVHRLTHVEPYLGTLADLLPGARVGYERDWCLTLIPGQPVEVL